MIEKKFEDFSIASEEKFTGICCFEQYGTKNKVWMLNGMWHRLNGPALVCNDNYNDGKYWINDDSTRKDDYWKHPLVMKNKLDCILEL